MSRLAMPIVCLLILVAPRLLAAQVTSGPSADAKIETLKVVAATGDSAGKEVDLATAIKEAHRCTTLAWSEVSSPWRPS